MNGRRQLITSDEAVPATGQHKKPCSDCPWARKSLKGWLGGSTADDWLREAHGDHEIPCHTLTGAQCAGAAIYRRNVSKLSLNDGVLRLDADKELVFATPTEFKRHHEGAAKPPDLMPVPGEGATEMPKSETIAANLKISAVKAKAADQVTKLKAAHEKKLLSASVKAKRDVDRVVNDLSKVDDLLKDIYALVGVLGVPAGEKAKKKILALTDKARKVADKYLR